MKYFVVYRWKYEGRDYDSNWYIVNDVLDRHPVDELIRLNAEHCQGYKYQLLFWSEIPDDVTNGPDATSTSTGSSAVSCFHASVAP
ncbi:hypothetical protein RG903_05205 [Thermithiobacillus tepidarius DSM 3134]|uniref:hypothetical protein n=1 Tax=Thermithiobacillus tepidarius TaxID=929 RepID=UPI00041F0A22|nr:hypothetical protein [Thermithiobacillus tepidarius]